MSKTRVAPAATKPGHPTRSNASSGVVFADKSKRSALVAPLTIELPSVTVQTLSGLEQEVRGVMRVLGECVFESRRSGRQISVVVHIDPAGGLRTNVDEDPSVEPEQAQDDDHLERALAVARARGRLKAVEILSGEDMLNGEAFAALLGVSRATVNAKRQHHEVLALEGAKRGFRFPSWQIDQDGKPFAAIPALFDRLGSGAWAVYRFLVQHHAELDGMTALEALRQGRGAEVIETAEGIAQGIFA
jgi:hypothetical protein